MRLRDWIIALSGLFAVTVGIFAMGGVLRWTQAIVALITAVGVAATALSQRSFARMSPLVGLLGGAAVLTGLQLIPLPESVVLALNPAGAALRIDGAALLDVSPWSTVSTDPGASMAALVMILTLLGIAVIALRIATTERGRYRIVACVALCCGSAAGVAGIHRLLGLTELYGLYSPTDAEPHLLGPLLNTNSLACLTAMGAVLAIGLAAHRRQPGWMRVGWLLVVAACGAVTVSTVSRGATLALLGGSVVVVAILIAQRFTTVDGSRKRRTRLLSRAVPMAVLAGCFLVLVIWSNATNVERQLSQLSFDEVHYSRSKFAAWRSSLALIEETPWLGIGRGAFESAFTRVHEASGLATYGYLENEYLQAVVDWGIPGALMLGLALLWLAYTSARRWRDSALSAGGLGAIVVVAMQSNVDFGLEFLGLAAPVTAIAATLAYVPLRETAKARMWRTPRVVLAVSLVLGGVLLMTPITKTLDEDRRELSHRASINSVRESVERHPLDYYGYAVAADLLGRDGDPRAILLLNHAMALHPTHPQLHHMAARMLFAQGRTSQSAIEYAAAIRTTPNPRSLLTEIAEKFTPEQAATAIPIDYPAPRAIVALLSEMKKPVVARVWLARVVKLRGKAAEACGLLYKLALDGTLEAAETAGELCADRLPDYVERVRLAKLLLAKNAQHEVIRLLQDVDSWQARRDEKIDAWLILCDAHTAVDHTDEAKRCLRRLDASPDMLEVRRTEILKRLEAINNARTASGSAQ